jgi:hypothetical protein
MSKKTAVEWLMSEVWVRLNMDYEWREKVYEQAKEMEKQNAIEFLEDYDSYVFRGGNGSAEEYYDKTFSK